MARTPASALQPAVGPTMTPRHQATTTRSRTASDVRNLEGRAQAFTVLTPVRRGWALWLRFNFFFARHVPYFTAKLRELSFIHYARCSIVTLNPKSAPRRPDGNRRSGGRPGSWGTKAAIRA